MRQFDIIFFYEIDDTVSERQGFVLDEISLDYQGQVIVLSFDKDYTDEPLIPILRDTYQVISAPTIIINNQYKEDLQNQKVFLYYKFHKLSFFSVFSTRIPLTVIRSDTIDTADSTPAIKTSTGSIISSPTSKLSTSKLANNCL